MPWKYWILCYICRNSVLSLKLHLLFKSNSISETASLKLYLLHLCARLVSLIWLMLWETLPWKETVLAAEHLKASVPPSIFSFTAWAGINNGAIRHLLRLHGKVVNQTVMENLVRVLGSILKVFSVPDKCIFSFL